MPTLSPQTPKLDGYKTPILVRVLRWIFGPFTEDFDRKRRAKTDHTNQYSQIR